MTSARGMQSCGRASSILYMCVGGDNGSVALRLTMLLPDSLAKTALCCTGCLAWSGHPSLLPSHTSCTTIPAGHR